MPPPGLATGGPGEMDLNLLIQLELLRTLQRRPDDEWAPGPPTGELGSRGVERSLKSLHQMKRMTKTQPRRLAEEYVAKTKALLGVQDGQVWNFTELSRRISWVRHKGLQRMHCILCELFVVLDAGQTEEAQALVAQALKAVHQAQLGDGSWQLAWHLTTL